MFSPLRADGCILHFPESTLNEGWPAFSGEREEIMHPISTWEWLPSLGDGEAAKWEGSESPNHPWRKLTYQPQTPTMGLCE